MNGSRYLSFILSVAVFLGPLPLYAQGFDFGSEGGSTEEVDDGSGGEGTMDDGGDTGDGGGITFDTSDLQTAPVEKKQLKIGVVALPGPNMDAKRRTELEARMNQVLKDVPENLYVGSEGIVADLQERGLAQCVNEPICLGAVGMKNEVDQLLIMQINPTPGGGETLTLDLFEPKDKLTLKYDKREGLAGIGDLLEAVKPMVYKVLEIREKRKLNIAGPEDTSIVSPVIAWTSLALALGSFGAGGYYTYLAKKADDALRKKIDGKEITQVAAYQENEAVKNKQTVSYVFYGLGAGLAAVSIIFFVIDIGGDVDSEQTASIQDLRVAPLLSAEGAGVTAGFSF